MNRFLAFILALIVATVTVSSACAEASSAPISFALTPDRSSNQIKARFRGNDRDFHHNDWSSSFVPSQLVGLDVAALRASGIRPLRFSLIRESGRIDCAGSGGNGNASGECSASLDPAFARILQSSGVAFPTPDQALGLVALDVRRDLVLALASARYPRPTVDDLMAMSAVGVTGRYVSGLAQAGYRPGEIHSLVEFKALGISPEWMGGFARAGLANLPPNELVQLKALDVTPDFITGYQRIGYGRLPASRLVQLKALGITPEFVRAHIVKRAPLPGVDELIEMKVFGAKQ